MNKAEGKAQTFLYFGILLALIAVDWHWYAGQFPDESFVLRLPFIGAVYVLWLAAIAVCFAASILLFWKAGKEQQIHRRRHRKSNTPQE